MSHPFSVEFIKIAKLLLLHENTGFHEQQNKLIILMMFEMETLHIIRKNAFIWVIEANNHAVAVIVHPEDVFVDRAIPIIDKACNAIVIIQRSDKWPITFCCICCNKPFSWLDIKYLRDGESFPRTII